MGIRGTYLGTLNYTPLWGCGVPAPHTPSTFPEGRPRGAPRNLSIEKGLQVERTCPRWVGRFVAEPG